MAHPGGHHLITASGQPFFWLADTAWELFHRTTRAEAEHYFDVRSQQGFNVIQAVILAEVDGLHTPNANGHVPLLGDDPTRPNEFYFRYVDELIRLAATKNLYIGLLPTWGDKVHGGMWGIGPVIFDVANARQYGEFLGRRYRDDSNILWILGGDRPAAGYERLWTAMAEGISAGLGYRPFITYHPTGEQTSSTWLHEQEWLTMNMQQSCHVFPDMNNWATIRADYARQPAKPALDAEPGYEDHPIDPFRRRWQPEFGRFTAYDVRKQAYRAVFAGACGHTYGHHSVWQFWTLEREPVNFPMPTWPEAILRPGATQLIHLKNLVLSRGFLNGVPDQALLPQQVEPPQAVGAAGDELRHPDRAAYAAAWRCADGTFAMVYFPLAEQNLAVDLGRLAGPVAASWYDPRTGRSHPAGQHPNSLTSFTSPIAGPDWVLVLDVTA
ncbi:MAG: glycoside hydrolase family 140 protein [Anaerolineales bacterium]|nr:glycoside hydrolase family 140 protein [Anaerolineales bacterium]